jgi:predicted aspartyl protease
VRSIFFGLVFAAAFSLFFSEDIHASGEIPFEFRDGLIWVKVETAARSYNFVLDSGAGASVVDARTAASLGLKLGSQLPVLGVDSHAVARYAEGFAGRIGDVPLNGSMLAIDLSGASRSCSRRIDGLIGADWFRGRIVEIDFRRKCFCVLEQPQSPVANPASVTLPIKARNGAFCVPIAVNGGKPSWVRLDTGCNTALQFVVDRRTEIAWLRTSIGLSQSSGRFASGEVQLGEKRLDGVKIGLHEREIFPGESGLLGTGILSKFKVTIDLKANRLFLAENQK